MDQAFCHPERSESSRSEVLRSRRTPAKPVAPPMRQGILTTPVEYAGEFPKAAVKLPALPGSFDSVFASLRETNSPLRMTFFSFIST
jgi:hypothetical protein